MKRKPLPSIKYFECPRCGCGFRKQITSPVARCIKCEYPCIDYRLKNPRPMEHLTDDQILRTLDPYSQMKYGWYRYPESWKENIRRREIQTVQDGNEQVYLKDSSGKRVGKMPNPVEII